MPLAILPNSIHEQSAGRRRAAIDAFVKARTACDFSQASRYMSDDVEMYHLDATSEPIRGMAAVIRFFQQRGPTDRRLEIGGIFAGANSILVHIRGRFESAAAFSFDDEGKIRQIQAWHSVGTDFGLTP